MNERDHDRALDRGVVHAALGVKPEPVHRLHSVFDELAVAALLAGIYDVIKQCAVGAKVGVARSYRVVGVGVAASAVAASYGSRITEGVAAHCSVGRVAPANVWVVGGVVERVEVPAREVLDRVVERQPVVLILRVHVAVLIDRLPLRVAVGLVLPVAWVAPRVLMPAAPGRAPHHRGRDRSGGPGGRGEGEGGHRGGQGEARGRGARVAVGRVVGGGELLGRGRRVRRGG